MITSFVVTKTSSNYSKSKKKKKHVVWFDNMNATVKLRNVVSVQEAVMGESLQNSLLHVGQKSIFFYSEINM